MPQARNSSAVSPDLFLFLLGVILNLRLIIWEFFRSWDAFFRENFSDVAIAVLTCALVIPWLLGKLINRQTLKESGLELPVLILFTAAASTLFYTVDFFSSLRSVLVLGAEIALFYILLDLLDTPARLRWSLIFLVAIAFVTSLFGLWTFFDYVAQSHLLKDPQVKMDNNLTYLLLHPRAVSFFGWPNTLAGFLLLSLPLAIILPIYLKEKRHKIFAAINLFILIACFFCTFSFLGWSSFLLSSFVILPSLKERFKLRTWPFIFVFLLLFSVIILHKDFWMSLSPRIFYYQAAFSLLMKNPLGGWGWNTFGIMSSSLTGQSNILSSYVHNSYLQAWVEAGIVGFGGIILLAVLVFQKAKAAIDNNKQDPEYLIFLAIAWGMIAFLIDNLFSFTILQANIAIYWWAMLAVFCAMLRVRGSQAVEVKRKLIIGGFLFLVVIIFVVLVRIAGAYALYYQAKRNINNSNPIWMLGSNANAVKILTRAENLDPWNGYIPAAIGESHINLYAMTHFKGLLMEAKTDYLEAARCSPKYYYNYFVLSKIYAELGDKAKAVNFAQKSQELSPGEFKLDNIMFHKSDHL